MIYPKKLMQYLILNDIHPNFSFQDCFCNIEFAPYRYIYNDYITLKLKMKQFDDDFNLLILDYLKVPLVYPILLTHIRNLKSYYPIMYYYGINFLLSKHNLCNSLWDDPFKQTFLKAILFNKHINHLFKTGLIYNYIQYIDKECFFNQIYYIKQTVIDPEDKNSFHNYWIESFIKSLTQINIDNYDNYTFIYDVPLDVINQLNPTIIFNINSENVDKYLPFILRLSHVRNMNNLINTIFYNFKEYRPLILKYANLSNKNRLKYESIILMDKMSHS